MRITVLGKSPSWQDAGGACSGYLVEDGDTRLLLDCGNGVFAKLRERLDYTELDAVLISHLHADHFLDLVPYSYALTYAPRQQPVPGRRLSRDRQPGPPAADRAERARRECFRQVVGAWGNEDLIEKAFAIEEYDAGSAVEVGTLRARFQEVPHFTTTYAVDFTSTNGGGRFTYGADCRPGDELIEIARDTDLLIVEATLPRPERTGIRGHMTPPRPAITPAGPARGASSSPTSPTSSTRTGPRARARRPSARRCRWPPRGRRLRRLAPRAGLGRQLR